MANPRAAKAPDPNMLSSLPVGKRTSARIPTDSGTPLRRLTLTRASTSPSPVLDPSTARAAREVGSAGAAGGGGPSGPADKNGKGGAGGGGLIGLVGALLSRSRETL